MSGACTECYTGYKVQGRDCVLGTDAIDQPNCKVVAGDFCQECYPRFYIKNGKCEQVNPFCRGYN